jgi:glycine betaine/choline ABC-type transport system substrate-binding protein
LRRITACLFLVLLASSCANVRKVVVGGKDTTEQVILAEIVAQHLENRLGRPVERRGGVAGTLLAHQSLVSGEVDLYVEYTGDALVSILKEVVNYEAAVVRERVRQFYRERMNATWIDPLGFENPNVLVVRASELEARKVSSLTEAAAAPWRLGISYDFQSREDGLAILSRSYGLTFKSAPRAMERTLLEQGLEQRALEMISARSTDAFLEDPANRILRDDQGAFPPFEAAIVVRQDALAAVPQLAGFLAELSGKISQAEIRRMNADVDRRKKPAGQVAAAWLTSSGLRK